MRGALHRHPSRHRSPTSSLATDLREIPCPVLLPAYGATSTRCSVERAAPWLSSLKRSPPEAWLASGVDAGQLLERCHRENPQRYQQDNACDDQGDGKQRRDAPCRWSTWHRTPDQAEHGTPPPVTSSLPTCASRQGRTRKRRRRSPDEQGIEEGRKARDTEDRPESKRGEQEYARRSLPGAPSRSSPLLQSRRSV